MAVEIVVPRLGWSMDEGTFLEWLKRDGEMVRAGQMLFVLEGEKASQEIESFDSGILRIPDDAPRPGDTVVVGQRLAFLLAEGEEMPQAGAAATAVAPSPAPATLAGASASSASAENRVADSSRVRATPRARRAARRLGVDCTTLSGTGRHGRIRERDVLAQAGAPAAVRAPSVPGRLQPASNIRRSIAQRMLAGVQQTAPVTLTTKIIADALVKAREQIKEAGAEPVPSFNDLLVHLVAQQLKADCTVNCCWRDDGICQYDEVNVAIGIDTKAGLLAPVIRRADELSLEQLAEQTRQLAASARAGQLRSEQLIGGTFTITSLGIFGIDAFTPIINLPQAAILGIGRILLEPVVVGDEVVPGHTLTLSLTFDHRAIDGAPAARWLRGLAERLGKTAHQGRPLT